MLLYNAKAESRCLSTLTSPLVSERLRYYLFAKLSPEYFHHPACLSAFNRLLSLTKKYGALVTWDELLADPVLEEDFRTMLGTLVAEPVRRRKPCDRMLDVLNSYRKIRKTYAVAKATIESLKGEKVDIDPILDVMAAGISEARVAHNNAPLYSIGKDGNSESLVKSVLRGNSVPFYRTGFNGYDSKNGGLPLDGVMVIAATSGSGKSCMLMNLLKNLYEINKISTFKVTLEMGDSQEARRLMSCLSGVPLFKFIHGTLERDEKKLAFGKYRQFQNFGLANDCRFSTLSPTTGMSIDQVLMTAQPYGFDVVAIDYITLLAGTDNDRQAQVLSNIARQCKEFSRANNCLVIILAQLDDSTGNIRYSRALKEHADVVWTWKYPDRTDKKIEISSLKTRDGEVFDFFVRENFMCMQLSDYVASEADATAAVADKKQVEEDVDYTTGVS